MASKALYVGYPYDQPSMKEHGVLYKESEYHGSMSRMALAPEDEIRRRKGDLSMKDIKDFEPRALSHSGLPFANLKGGK